MRDGTLGGLPRAQKDKDPGRSELETYGEDEIRALLDACDERPRGVRDRLAILLMWCAGLTQSELLMLDSDAWTARTGRVSVPGKRARTVMVPRVRRREITSAWGRWVAEWTPIVDDPSTPFICNLQGDRIDDSYYRRMLPRLAARAGLKRRVHAQGLRHTFAADMYRSGVPVELIWRQMGHAKLSFTVAYLARLCRERPTPDHEYLSTSGRGGGSGKSGRGRQAAGEHGTRSGISA